VCTQKQLIFVKSGANKTKRRAGLFRRSVIFAAKNSVEGFEPLATTEKNAKK
jgi:hypothetical protein